MSRLWTIGHSTHSFDAFVALLRAHEIDRLADVRLIPKSKRHPHFAIEHLSTALPRQGIAYRHFRDLGGHRRPRPDSPNAAWRNESFRGYADYLTSDAFVASLAALLDWASEPGARVAIVCAEAVFWRCHRQLIADALLARGHEVLHITSTSAATPHTLTSFARVREGRLNYPGLWNEGTEARADGDP